MAYPARVSSPPPPTWPGHPGQDHDPTTLRPVTAPTPGSLTPGSLTPDTTTLRPAADPKAVEAAARAARRSRFRRNARRTIVVVLVCGLAILLGVVGGAVARYGQRMTAAAPPTDSTTPSASTTPTPDAATAADPASAVRGFLEAVARSDAQGALAYGQTQPADTSMITDTVLAAAHQDNPITEINVPPGPTAELDDGDQTDVEASYKIGTERVTQTYTVVRSGQRFLLTDIANEVDVSSERSQQIPMIIAGHEVDSDTIVLLPGAYDVTSGLPYVDWGNTTTLLVKAPDASVDTSGLELGLTDAGSQALLTAAQAAVKACLSQHSLTPKGCPFSYDTTDKVTAKTITWALSNDPFADAEPQLSSESDAVGQVRLTLSLKLTYSGTSSFNDDKVKREQSVSAYPTATADLTQSSLTITWKS